MDLVNKQTAQLSLNTTKKEQFKTAIVEALHHNSTNRCFIASLRKAETNKGLENLENAYYERKRN
jgi:hypothetical protein